MSRLVQCVKLDKEAEGLDMAPYPGELGQRIFENISKEAWQMWMGQQTILINEHRLNVIDPEHRAFIEREMEKFLLELGAGFAFLARQKRIIIDNEDFYMDLLFYNRKLKRLIVLELKLGDFKAEYKGQMELYLRWLDKYERQHGEESPPGIILCAGKRQEQIELLELDKAGIHVAEYVIVLPSRQLLQKKLRDAINTYSLHYKKRGDKK